MPYCLPPYTSSVSLTKLVIAVIVFPNHFKKSSNAYNAAPTLITEHVVRTKGGLVVFGLLLRLQFDTRDTADCMMFRYTVFEEIIDERQVIRLHEI